MKYEASFSPFEGFLTSGTKGFWGYRNGTLGLKWVNSFGLASSIDIHNKT